MLIVTNRNIIASNFNDDGVGDARAFGDGVNAKGPNEVRLAHANKVDENWQVRLVDEPPDLRDDTLPSRHEFRALRDKLIAGGRHCVLFVHGFNQSFEDNLEKSLFMERQYAVDVIAFSWPSNSGGLVLSEYRHAKRTAMASTGALDSTLEKIAQHMRTPFDQAALEACGVRFSLIAFSLGNFLFENYVRGSLHDGEPRLFDNVVLCQPDVDSRGHEDWVDRIGVGKRTYVTINENDKVLGWAETVSGRDRLGRSALKLNAAAATYFDFTDGEGVGDTHGVFYKKTNPHVSGFFSTVLNGRRGETSPGFEYDKGRNCYHFTSSSLSDEAV